MKYYGEWMREKAWERIGHLYPQVDLPSEYGGGQGDRDRLDLGAHGAKPGPSVFGCKCRLLKFLLSSKKGQRSLDRTDCRQVQRRSFEFRHKGNQAESRRQKGHESW